MKFYPKSGDGQQVLRDEKLLILGYINLKRQITQKTKSTDYKLFIVNKTDFKRKYFVLTTPTKTDGTK